ncbi:hypothetical protein SAMN02982929_02360 [Saccharopolyspora kobensis]|uniref:Polyketide cyclase / dehydrase and lipid transport n=1 Tax=Saccharopolyspora kobensis TaxID=146035 RepID=A0A1H6AM35_9PSEU|nr:hypothetical protein [Saccharopolyspora kobensis]SEG48826.1 hypothetical protein SAMN02982929_02360 [Saccharopolyspora kobensis]SFE58476.1 hypothetical protein SAMN05216506_112194 [Saccharopolyspora kobensis]
MSEVLEKFVPQPLGAERHELHIRQSPEVVWNALNTFSPGDLPVVRLLMGIRSLPDAGPATAGSSSMIGTMLQRGWFELATEPQRYVVLGSISQFWRLRPGDFRRTCPAEQFRDHDEPGFAKSASVFELVPIGGGTLLRTETRITAGSATARRKMLSYWRFIRPFSGLIRRVMLRAVARKAAAA